MSLSLVTREKGSFMVRTILLLIALLIVIGIALVSFDVISLRRDGGSVSIETKDVEVGTTTQNVQVPVVKMETRQVEVPNVGIEQNAQANVQ